MDWKSPFKKGIELFKQNQFEEALESMNTAIRINNSEKNLFDSRAAVYEKLGLPLDALKDAKKVIDLAPEWWQGYARSARLFFQVNKLEASLKMVDIARELLKSTDSKRRDELEALRLQVVKALEPLPCFFSRMPVEIQSGIFTLIIDKSNSRMLALTLVCRSWREIILNMPTLWRHLVLSPKTKIKMVDTWLQRSKGLLSSLRILEGFSFETKPRILKHVSVDIWTKLDLLEIQCGNSSINRILPPGAVNQLRLQRLELNISGSASNFQILCGLDTSRTQTLVLFYVSRSELATLEKLTFRSLTTLILRDGCIRNGAFSLLEGNPLLETVILDSGFKSYRGSDTPNVTEKVKLVHLKRFELRLCYWSYYYLDNILYPNLETFKLESDYSNEATRCFEALSKQKLTQLQSISLRCCMYSSDALISLLRASSALKELTLSNCFADQEDENSVISALAGTAGAAGAEKNPHQEQDACCPLLQHLDLSSSPRLRSGPISRLVKARLARGDICSDGEPSSSTMKNNENRARPLPILSLNIDDCPMINPDALPLLRSMVPRLSARLTPVKIRKGKGTR